MKLGALKVAIRKLKGSPKVGGTHHTDVGPVELTDLEVTKQSMIAAIDRAFPDGSKATETGLWLKPNGHIGVEGVEDTVGEYSQEPVEGAAPEAADDELEDVLG